MRPFAANCRRPIDEDVEMRRVPILTLAVVGTWIVTALWIDQHVGRIGQLGIGLVSAGVLAALLALHPRAVRAQTLAVIAIATLGELVGSILWGVYTYRLENLPTFVPPGHGLVYLAGLSLATLARSRPSVLMATAVAASVTWAALGLAVLPATDVSGAIGATFLVCVLLTTRRAVYAGVFVVVAGLEIYGTAVGTWTWQGVVPGLGVPQGNPPSGAASGYVVFDVLAFALVAALQSARRGRSAAASSTTPSSISAVAESTLPHVSQSKNPRALPSPST